MYVPPTFQKLSQKSHLVTNEHKNETKAYYSSEVLEYLYACNKTIVPYNKLTSHLILCATSKKVCIYMKAVAYYPSVFEIFQISD